MVSFDRRNIALKIEYDGTQFAGWQRQAQKPSIQGLIEDELATLLKRRVVVYGAGRTDSGVHARGQVANFWGDNRYPAEQWARILNFRLPKTVRILKSAALDEAFHAQKFAVSKVYEYFVLNRRFQSALETRVCFQPRPLDWEKIRECLPHFVGIHDFAAFQGAKASVKTTVRHLKRFDLEQLGDGLYRFEVEGEGFLKQMVRAMVGTALEVGEGRRPSNDIPRILSSRDRRQAGRTAPACGLFLSSVQYPSPYDSF